MYFTPYAVRKYLQCFQLFSLHLGGHTGSTLEIGKGNSLNIRCTSPKNSIINYSIPAGVEVTAGDYFKSETLPTADVIPLEHIAHMYPRRALMDNGIIIIPND